MEAGLSEGRDLFWFWDPELNLICSCVGLVELVLFDAHASLLGRTSDEAHWIASGTDGWCATKKGTISTLKSADIVRIRYDAAITSLCS